MTDITDKAVEAMEEMQAAGIPVKEFETSEAGFDFWFKRGLTKAEAKKAQAIAKKYIPTKYTWHGE